MCTRRVSLLLSLGIVFTIGATLNTAGAQNPASERNKMESVENASWQFGGEMGNRVDANVRNWLLRAPETNPGIIEMFRVRDRHPVPQLVPWAGEFAGKYLISAVQALRMSDDPALEPAVRDFVHELIGTQADDGYLGPFTKDQRLLGAWDLWGHYHVMLGLLMWYDHSGDEAAWQSIQRAADLICSTYLDGDRRPIQAGSPECNLGVLHIMSLLHHRTGNPRYLAMCQRVEEDMQQAGDWLRLGAAGTPYYRLPNNGTRWETLHIVQGLAERYRESGDSEYKDAVVKLWESLRDSDRHPSGAFSSSESATGNPYGTGSIETCCSIAWLALSLDVLELTGDSRVADEMELTTWNEILGAQHPSGSWWTYNTPINGVRIPSFHDINFQYRVGTPELNCCSVNAPRGLGILPDWAVLEQPEGLVVNYYGPYQATLKLRNGEQIALTQTTAYPLDGRIRLELAPKHAKQFTIRLRIPQWTAKASVKVNGKALEGAEAPQPGTYYAIDRKWRKGDSIELTLDLTPHHWTGGGAREGRAAVYAGPLLLAFDPYFNAIDTDALPRIDLAGQPLTPQSVDGTQHVDRYLPMGLWSVPTEDGGSVVLCDFATAGAHGTDYVAWLPAVHTHPRPLWLREPYADSRVAMGPTLFRWTTFSQENAPYRFTVARDPELKDEVFTKDIDGTRVTVPESFEAGKTYYWKVSLLDETGARDAVGSPWKFTVDASIPRAVPADWHPSDDPNTPFLCWPTEDASTLRGFQIESIEVTPAAGPGGTPEGALHFGATSKLRYRILEFPDRSYSFIGWVYPENIAAPGLKEIFSCWAAGNDDPLRVAIDGTDLVARIENGGLYGTKGVPIEGGKWLHVAAVKQGDTLTLYVNGAAAASAPVPERVATVCEVLGVGLNPAFMGGSEHFSGKLADFAFYGKALTAEEISERYKSR